MVDGSGARYSGYLYAWDEDDSLPDCIEGVLLLEAK
jgi:hypothetical protein